VTFGSDQISVLKKSSNIPGHIETMIDNFHNQLSPEEQADSRFAYRVAFVPKIASRASKSDLAIEFVKADSPEAAEVNRVLLKEVEKPKYRPGQIVNIMRSDGFSRFNMVHHTDLWQSLNAKAADKGYGHKVADGQWYWYDSWLNRVREHCIENAGRYQQTNS
jgi:hypothetical protein